MMKTVSALTVKDLIENLQQCDPDALVVTTLWNGWTDTYCAVDQVKEFSYEYLSNDFFGTPGATDDRVFCSDKKNVVLITSTFDLDEVVSRDKHENLKDNLNYWHQDGND